ncbi:VOC family protein [Agrobacterium tumefaciens]|uniref:VOC family protein n=1 Tax=Agrobacterium tumefaciens TaxID=358 RepID=UPI00287D97B9|nr:VOC family protein [Agrobacterium tumefaciens]MDS7596445.1 VOC family protein [Agrobacterium tumefaciens]
MSDTHGKFIWVELMTPDTPAAGRFYSHVIGWGLKDYGSPDMDYTIFEADGVGIGGMMALTETFAAEGIPPNWTAYVAVDDVDASARQFSENGGSVMRQPQDIPEIGRFAVVTDPFGAVLCIMTPLPMDTGDFPKDTQSLQGHVGWYELFTDNVDEATDFYGAVFGWTKDHDFDMGEMGPYRIFAHNGKAVGGMMKRLPQVPVCHWGYYFNVDGIDDAITRVSTGGGKVVNGPMEVPGGSWIVNCVDPQGAYFSLLSQKK